METEPNGAGLCHGFEEKPGIHKCMGDDKTHILTHTYSQYEMTKIYFLTCANGFDHVKIFQLEIHYFVLSLSVCKEDFIRVLTILTLTLHCVLPTRNGKGLSLLSRNILLLKGERG